MLGYDSPAELQRIGGILGVFANPDERSRVLGSAGNGHRSAPRALFRTKDGVPRALRVMAADCPEQDSVALAVFDDHPPFTPHAA